MKDGWGRYASKERFKQKGYFRKHCDGSTGRKAREASHRDRLLKSRKEQEEIRPLNKPPVPDSFKEEMDAETEWYGKIVQLTDEEIIFTGENHEEARLQCETRRCARSEERQEEPINEESSQRIGSDGEGRTQEKVQRRQEDEVNEKARERKDRKALKEGRQGIQKTDQRGSGTEEILESLQEEVNHGESKTGIGCAIQGSGESSSPIGSCQSSSSRGSSRNEKVRQRKNGENGSGRKKKKS